jgi:glutamate racemase
MKIGIFDSGIGGLSVLHQAMIIMPEADYIFYAFFKSSSLLTGTTNT